MAEVYRETQRGVEPTADRVDVPREERVVDDRRNVASRGITEDRIDNRNGRGVAKTSIAARLVHFIGALIVTILALRFVLSLLGANRSNAFANVIYTVSHPFVVPFFGLFNYREQFGVSRFEYETLIAIVVWALVAYGIGKLINIGRRDRV
ncbi:MAG: hypothetical protein NVSMB46_04910 [Candidatus Saccharimonadales bacterium]